MEPLASAVVRIAADDTPLKATAGRLAGLLHEIADAIDRYVADEPTGVPWPVRIAPFAPTPLDVPEDK